MKTIINMKTIILALCIAATAAVVPVALNGGCTMDSPARGDSYAEGETVHILWSGSGCPTEGIQIMLTAGMVPQSIIAQHYAGSSFDWTVPSDVPYEGQGDFQIGISSEGNGMANSRAFDITAAPHL